MANKIQFRRGVKANLPLLSQGEPAFTTDTKEFFIGDGIENIEYAKKSEVDAVNTTIGNKASLLTAIKTSIVLAINELFNSKLNKSDIANNVVTTNPNMALAAPQGKYLQDQINEQNVNLTALTNRTWNYLPVGSAQITLLSYILNNLPYGGTIAFPGSIFTDLPLNTWGVAEVVRHAALIWSVTLHFSQVNTMYYNQIYIDRWNWTTWIEK